VCIKKNNLNPTQVQVNQHKTLKPFFVLSKMWSEYLLALLCFCVSPSIQKARTCFLVLWNSVVSVSYVVSPVDLDLLCKTVPSFTKFTSAMIRLRNVYDKKKIRNKNNCNLKHTVDSLSQLPPIKIVQTDILINYQYWMFGSVGARNYTPPSVRWNEFK